MGLSDSDYVVSNGKIMQEW